MKTVNPTKAIMGQKPLAWRMVLIAAESNASSVPPAAVVPFGKVPLRTMVLVPLMSATLTKVRFRFEYVPSPIKESRKVVFPLSSQPHSAYIAQRHVTGLVSSTPVSCRISMSKWRSRVSVVVFVVLCAVRLWNVYG